MLERLEFLGRVRLDSMSHGMDSSHLWEYSLSPFTEDLRANRDEFLADLLALVANDQGGFATFGAAHIAWEMYGGDCLNIPAALPLIDAGIDFKLARGLSPSVHFSGGEKDRLAQRLQPTSAAEDEQP